MHRKSFGLLPSNCFVYVFCSAMAVDEIDPCGVYFGATGWQVYASANSGDSWMTIVRDLPPSAVCRGASTTMIRVALPLQLCGLANVSREIELEVEDTASISTGLDGLEIRHPRLSGTIRDQLPLQRRPFIWFFAYGEDLSLHPPTSSLPENVVTGKQPLRIVGSMAGG